MCPSNEPSADKAEARAERAAERAVERAAALAIASSEKATALAVARAIKDRDVERDLAEHGKHLTEINGSQREMVVAQARMQESFDALVVRFDEAAAVSGAIKDYIEEQKGNQITSRQFKQWAAATVVAVAAVVVALLTALAPHPVTHIITTTVAR